VSQDPKSPGQVMEDLSDIVSAGADASKPGIIAKVRIILSFMAMLIRFAEVIERRGGEKYWAQWQDGFEKWTKAETPEQDRDARKKLAQLYFDA